MPILTHSDGERGWRLHSEKTKGKEKHRKWSRGILWPDFKETGGKNRENEISVLMRGNEINLSISAEIDEGCCKNA